MLFYGFYRVPLLKNKKFKNLKKLEPVLSFSQLHPVYYFLHIPLLTILFTELSSIIRQNADQRKENILRSDFGS